MTEHIETLDKLFYDEKLSRDVVRSLAAKFTTYKHEFSVSLKHADDAHAVQADITTRPTKVLKYSYRERAKDTNGYWLITCRAAMLVKFRTKETTQAVVDIPVQLIFKVRSVGVTIDNRGDKAFSVESAVFTQAPKVTDIRLEHNARHLTEKARSIANGETYYARQYFDKYQNDLLEVARNADIWPAELTPLTD